MDIAIIVAATENNVIGNNNQLIWHLPNDLKRFKALTMGHPIIMGRKTFESIGKPLPGRHSIIISRQKDYAVEGCSVVSSLEEAIQTAGSVEPVYIIGGAEIYKQSIEVANTICFTRVHTALDGDAYFPPINLNDWRVVEMEKHSKDEKHEYGYTFMTLKKLIAPH